MGAVEWLEEFAKLDELIQGKQAERQRVWAASTGTVAGMDGMPHAPGVADKVGNLTVKIVALEEEIHRYERRREEMLRILERLPADEYGVLHREYVRYMKQEDIAREMGYCTVQIWRIKKRAVRRLEDLLG